jgi:glyoxylase-like metal-dependent hydrolase (beta-lactamase superfamily II)
MFSGDLILDFLNPNDLIDGSIKETRASMLRMLQLAEAGGIDILAPGHNLPVCGQDNVAAYLRSAVARQEEPFDTMAAIVSSCPDKDDFEEIINKVYAHESDLIRGLIKVNFPRTISFLEVYVYIYLKEFVNETMDINN